MYNKVEICGVNTSRLKVLTEAEKRALLQKIRHGTPAEREQAREEMINGNLKLVLSVIQRFTNRGENLDDLFQVGCIGLMKAIDNFNPDLDVKFSTYGVPMIIGEIRRYLRDNNSIRVSRSLRDTAYKAMQVKERLQAENSREPTVEQIAKELNLPRSGIHCGSRIALRTRLQRRRGYHLRHGSGGRHPGRRQRLDRGNRPASGNQRAQRP